MRFSRGIALNVWVVMKLKNEKLMLDRAVLDWLSRVSNVFGLELSDWLKKLVHRVLTNQSKHAGSFFNQSGGKPKPIVIWLMCVLPRLARVTCFLALGRLLVFPRLPPVLCFPAFGTSWMLLFRVLIGLLHNLRLLLWLLTKCDYFHVDFCFTTIITKPL